MITPHHTGNRPVSGEHNAQPCGTRQRGTVKQGHRPSGKFTWKFGAVLEGGFPCLVH